MLQEEDFRPDRWFPCPETPSLESIPVQFLYHRRIFGAWPLHLPGDDRLPWVFWKSLSRSRANNRTTTNHQRSPQSQTEDTHCGRRHPSQQRLPSPCHRPRPVHLLRSPATDPAAIIRRRSVFRVRWVNRWDQSLERSKRLLCRVLHWTATTLWQTITGPCKSSSCLGNLSHLNSSNSSLTSISSNSNSSSSRSCSREWEYRGILLHQMNLQWRSRWRPKR